MRSQIYLVDLEKKKLAKRGNDRMSILQFTSNDQFGSDRSSRTRIVPVRMPVTFLRIFFITRGECRVPSTVVGALDLERKRRINGQNVLLKC